MAPRQRLGCLLLAPLLLGAAAAAASAPGAADDAVALLQLPAAGAPSLEAGDEVEVEALEGIPGSLVPGTVTGSGALPGTYNVAVWDAPPEHRFMTDVEAESVQLRKAHRSATVPPLSLQVVKAGDQDLFAALDADRDGGISRSELAQALARLVGSAPAVVPAPPPPAAAALRAAPVPLPRADAEPEAAAKPTAAPAAPVAPAALPAGKDCWVSGYSRDACCDLYWGPNGDENCWDGFFTFQRCCKPDDQVVQEAQRYSEDVAARKAEQEERKAQEEKQKEERRRKEEEEAAARQGEERSGEDAAREQQRKAEAEARERYDAELRRRAREEDRRIAREQAQKRTEEQAKSKAAVEAKRKADEAERLAQEQKACPEGFQYLVGDVPGFDQFGHDDKLKRKSADLCGKECSKNALCQSFEWSAAKTQCNLNKVADPKTPVKYMDFVFCKRLRKA